MARLENVIFCLTATRSSNQISANNIMAVLTPEYIPGLFSFSVILTVLDVEPNSKHMIYVKFIDQHQEVIGEAKGEVILEDNSNIPSEYKGLNITINWTNLNIKTTGLYQLIVYWDTNQIGEKEIYVQGKIEK